MDKKAIDGILFDLISSLYKWFGLKQILRALADLEERHSVANRATGIYWDAKHNAGLLQSTADSIRE